MKKRVRKVYVRNESGLMEAPNTQTRKSSKHDNININSPQALVENNPMAKTTADNITPTFMFVKINTQLS